MHLSALSGPGTGECAVSGGISATRELGVNLGEPGRGNRCICHNLQQLRAGSQSACQARISRNCVRSGCADITPPQLLLLLLGRRTRG